MIYLCFSQLNQSKTQNFFNVKANSNDIQILKGNKNLFTIDIFCVSNNF